MRALHALPTLAASLAVMHQPQAGRRLRSGEARLFFGGSLPEEVAADLDPTVSPSEVLPLWRELRKCYPSERAAIDAALKQPLVLLPFINTKDNIRFCFQVLGELGFTDSERLEIITKNPGVLANRPGELASTSPGEILTSVKVVTAVDSIPEPIRRVIPTVTAVTIVALIAKRLSECAGGICG